MLVRFECGCIGFPPSASRPGELPRAPGAPVLASDGDMLVVRTCDGDAEVGFGYRPMTDKSFAPLDPAAEADIIRLVARMVADGHRFRDLLNILGLPR